MLTRFDISKAYKLVSTCFVLVICLKISMLFKVGGSSLPYKLRKYAVLLYTDCNTERVL